MWQHLENVKRRLLEFSNVDDIYFDGYLFDSAAGQRGRLTPSANARTSPVRAPLAAAPQSLIMILILLSLCPRNGKVTLSDDAPFPVPTTA